VDVDPDADVDVWRLPVAANIPPGIVAMTKGMGKVKRFDAVEQQAKLPLSAGAGSQQYSSPVVIPPQGRIPAPLSTPTKNK
jgi:hypothetical protein